jgi:hypothetical protein
MGVPLDEDRADETRQGDAENGAAAGKKALAQCRAGKNGSEKLPGRRHDLNFTIGLRTGFMRILSVQMR